MKVLVVNCYLDPKLAQEFELEMARNLVLDQEPVEIAFARPGEGIPGDLDGFSRLLVSGSEAAAWEDNPWDGPLTLTIRAFVEASRPVLGICYGHQFIVRALAGREHVRRRARRVWGWLAVDLAPSPLTRGLERVVAVTCNSDEVFDLPAEFRVLAGADHCRVLAFEHRTKPVWGVQFHPEYGPEYGRAVLDFTFAETDQSRYSSLDQRRGENCLEPNTRLFRNFLLI